MARHGMTLDTVAEALGLSRRMLAYYRSGERRYSSGDLLPKLSLYFPSK